MNNSNTLNILNISFKISLYLFSALFIVWWIAMLNTPSYNGPVGLSFPVVIGGLIANALIPFIIWLIRYFYTQQSFTVKNIYNPVKGKVIHDQATSIIQSIQELKQKGVLSEEEASAKIKTIEDNQQELLRKKKESEEEKQIIEQLKNLKKAGVITNEEFEVKINQLNCKNLKKAGVITNEEFEVKLNQLNCKNVKEEGVITMEGFEVKIKHFQPGQISHIENTPISTKSFLKKTINYGKFIVSGIGIFICLVFSIFLPESLTQKLLGKIVKFKKEINE
jgi:hypothetical protein